ncbi:MAG: hypothetical protein COB17_06710 [Sulfurimonas sp.]|nr:MAG: hypothetical protein COB17_06710 [Sulfurimonas sp.]
MSKRKKKSSKNSSNILTYIVWSLTAIALIIGALIAGYYIGYDESKQDQIMRKSLKLKKVTTATESTKNNSVNQRLKDILKKDKKDTDNRLEKLVNEKIYIGASHEYESSFLPQAPKRALKKVSYKPRLAIIIDDVSVKSQVDAIKALNMPLTMSFLPPSKFRPNSPALASKEKFYMVHLPMEAQSFTKEEPFTLRVKDSQSKISDRIANIKKLFPRVHYINNHTGSKFTSNEIAVNRLVYALDKLNINFIDSRTTAKTKVPKVMKNYGYKYIARDVFLDNEMDKTYIKKQIKVAINTAKKHGTAIAIGHPHANTILALRESKKLFKDVELVLINGLY